MLNFPTNCPSCNAPTETRMKLVGILFSYCRFFVFSLMPLLVLSNQGSSFTYLNCSINVTVCVSFCPLVCLSVRWSLHGYPSASVRPCVFLSVRPYVRALVLTSVSLSFCLWFFRCTYVIYTYSHQCSPFIKFYSLSITYKTGFTLTSISAIPHFKEVVIMATNCDACGHRSNEVKSGGK